jgi:acetyl-CoA synthetase
MISNMKKQKEGKEVILHNNRLVDSSRIAWARKMITLYETYKALGQNLFKNKEKNCQKLAIK